MLAADWLLSKLTKFTGEEQNNKWEIFKILISAEI